MGWGGVGWGGVGWGGVGWGGVGWTYHLMITHSLLGLDYLVGPKLPSKNVLTTSTDGEAVNWVGCVD